MLMMMVMAMVVAMMMATMAMIMQVSMAVVIYGHLKQIKQAFNCSEHMTITMLVMI